MLPPTKEAIISGGNGLWGGFLWLRVPVVMVEQLSNRAGAGSNGPGRCGAAYVFVACIAVIAQFGALSTAALAQDQEKVPPADRSKDHPAGQDGVEKDDQAEKSVAAGEEAQERVALRAEVLEVRGDVSWAGPDVSALATEGWTEVRVGDRLEAGTQIRTGLRSHLHLRLGQSNYVSIERATIASIDQLYRTSDKETIRIGLGYGAIRGGSDEGKVRSDLVVVSPVATMAKRGTKGWRISVEPHTGRFNISLARYGLVEAIMKLDARRSVRRSVRPGEYATARNIASMWLQQDIFNRSIKFVRPEAVTLADARFMRNNTTGVSMIAPGGGSQLADFTGRSAASIGRVERAPLTRALLLPPISRPEGNFGVPDTKP